MAITKQIIRKDVSNKKYWVGELYFNERPYPNVISGRYNSKKALRQALLIYRENNLRVPWGNV